MSIYLMVIVAGSVVVAGVVATWIGVRSLRRVIRASGGFLEMQRALLATQHGILVAQRSIAASLRLQDFYNRPVVKEHIAALQSDASTSSGKRTVLSYPTS